MGTDLDTLKYALDAIGIPYTEKETAERITVVVGLTDQPYSHWAEFKFKVDGEFVSVNCY